MYFEPLFWAFEQPRRHYREMATLVGKRRGKRNWRQRSLLVQPESTIASQAQKREERRGKGGNGRREQKKKYGMWSPAHSGTAQPGMDFVGDGPLEIDDTLKGGIQYSMPALIWVGYLLKKTTAFWRKRKKKRRKRRKQWKRWKRHQHSLLISFKSPRISF